MKEYLSSVMAISAVSALISLLIPDGKASKKYMKFVVGAVALLIISEPLTGLAEADYSDYESLLPEASASPSADGYLDAVIQNAEKVIAADVTEELFTKYRLSERYVDVYVRLDASDSSDVRVAELIITLKSYGTWADAEAITDRFSDKYDCEVKIAYE